MPSRSLALPREHNLSREDGPKSRLLIQGYPRFVFYIPSLQHSKTLSCI